MTLNLNELKGIQPELRAFLQRLGGVGIPFATPVNAVAATSTLSVDVNPTAGEEITIGSITYTFVANGTTPLVAGDIELEALVADTRPNIVLAINGTDGHNVLNANATSGAFAGADATLTATVAGVAGDSIVATTDMAGAGNGIIAFAGGLDGTPGVQGAACADANRIYICIAANTISGANWRRIPVAMESF